MMRMLPQNREVEILQKPTRQNPDLMVLLKEIAMYPSRTLTPPEKIVQVAEAIPYGYVLAAWARAGYGFGRRLAFSIEEEKCARQTFEIHRENYAAHNPRLMCLYSQKEWSDLTSNHQKS